MNQISRLTIHVSRLPTLHSSPHQRHISSPCNGLSIISFHFNDVNTIGPEAHAVPWGTGVNNIKGMLEEVHRQGVKAVFSVEYEYNWDKSLPEIAQSVAYFDKVSAEIAKS